MSGWFCLALAERLRRSHAAHRYFYPVVLSGFYRRQHVFAGLGGAHHSGGHGGVWQLFMHEDASVGRLLSLLLIVAGIAGLKLLETPRSLSDFSEIGCKPAWTVHIPPLFWAIEPTIALQNRRNLPSPSRIFASIPKVRQAPGH